MITINPILTTVIIVIEAIVLASCSPDLLRRDKVINSFEECAAAGYPIMESFPEQCRTPDGRLFVRELRDDGNGGGVAESWGTILGTVLLGPTCPVLQNPPDPNCADRPYQIDLALTSVDQSRVIKEFSSDVYGRFRIEVPAGEYAIRTAAAANVLPYCSTNEPIQVSVNGTTEVAVYCDTGIR